MGRIEIIGGKPLEGRIKVSGAKNEALKIIALSVLVQSKFTVSNVPDILDIRKQLEIFKDLGGQFTLSDDTLVLDGTGINKSVLKNGLATKLRASIVFLGPLLARFREVTVPFPGGCAIGRRPIETHLKAFKDLGAKVSCSHENYIITHKEFTTNKVRLEEQSVTATENVLLFLSYFEQEFEISNCAIEPEIMALCQILNDAGAKVSLTGEREIKILGTRELKLENATVISDRIEAFSYLIGFLITGGTGEIVNFPASYMKFPLEKLKQAGAKFTISGNQATILPCQKFKAFKLKTAPYPGFPTDMQSPMSLLAAKAEGTSIINEALFENRLTYIKQLKEMGLRAKILNKHKVEISGPSEITGAKIEALDLRSGITLVLAALSASGKSIIAKGEIIDRGYEDLRGKLTSIGADIKCYD